MGLLKNTLATSQIKTLRILQISRLMSAMRRGILDILEGIVMDQLISHRNRILKLMSMAEINPTLKTQEKVIVLMKGQHLKLQHQKNIFS